MDALLPRLLTAQDVALWLALPTGRVERMARAGQIPCVTLPDGSVVFDQEELAGWLDALRRDAAREQDEE
jgi:hypothetical protein